MNKHDQYLLTVNELNVTGGVSAREARPSSPASATRRLIRSGNKCSTHPVGRARSVVGLGGGGGCDVLDLEALDSSGLLGGRAGGRPCRAQRREYFWSRVKIKMMIS